MSIVPPRREMTRVSRLAALLSALLIASACGGGGEHEGEMDGGGDPTVSDAEVARDGRVRLPDAGPRVDGAGSGLLGPPYPVVLSHGFFGFEDFAGVGFISYYYEVRPHLEARGEVVYTPAVDPFNDSVHRGEALLAHIERILEETGHARVNLIAHSQGGIDSRYVAHVRPDLIASLTTISTPHRGTPVADVVLRLVEDGRWLDLADRLVRLIAAPLWDASGEETSVFASLRQLSSPGMLDFNTRYTNASEVAYYSIAGRTARHLGDPHCAANDIPEFIGRYAFTRDPTDPLLDLTERVTRGPDNDPNDGLVRVIDARWGRFLGCIPADHLDEIGHLFGGSPGFGNDFDYRRFYVELIEWLRAQGH